MFAFVHIQLNSSFTTTSKNSNRKSPVRNRGAFRVMAIKEITSVFPKHRNQKRAEGAAKYMKYVAPFLGIQTKDRRQMLWKIFDQLPDPTSKELGETALALIALPEREYHYAAYDLVDYFLDFADEKFLKNYGEKLLITKSWWDTVDGFGTSMVSPLTIKYPDKPLMTKWINSKNIWLNRAAIQHQRGRKNQTEIQYVISLCQKHAKSKEFFITKAIGWALRDISRIDKAAVRAFLTKNPDLDSVALREAKKYL